jgi:hypothetical protein
MVVRYACNTAHVAGDWFRSPDWSPDAQADFEARLMRARPYNRAQYLRIKGLALAEAGWAREARRLWERVLESTDELAASQQASAMEHLGESYEQDDPAIAEDYFRRLLVEYPTLNGTSHTVEISLAELLIDRGGRASIEEALALLNSFLERGTAQLPSVLFRWHLALIRIAQATGDEETLRRAARTALDLAGRAPVFARHQTVGVVHADTATVKRLRELAR